MPLPQSDKSAKMSTGGGYDDKGGIEQMSPKSEAGPNGVDCPAAGAFGLNSGPSSAKKIVTPTQKDHEDDVGNASCFDPNNYEKSAC